MKIEEISKYPTKILSETQRKKYFSDGFLGVEEILPEKVLIEIQEVTACFQEKSRTVEVSDDTYDIGPGHSSKNPVLRRLKSPDIRHKAYWSLAKGFLADVASDLLGPNVVFHHSKLNFKWFDASDAVKWHQDIQFFPHTNYNVLTIGCYLADTDMSNGPLAAIKGSHNDKLYNQYDCDGNWLGRLSNQDAEKIDLNRVEYLTGKAGTITIHNARTLHYSPSSKKNKPRPLLLFCYTAADAKPYTPHPQPTENSYKIIRGNAPVWAEHDPRPCQLPPDWSKGYTSIYAAQSGEDSKK